MATSWFVSTGLTSSEGKLVSFLHLRNKKKIYIKISKYIFLFSLSLFLSLFFLSQS